MKLIFDSEICKMSELKFCLRRPALQIFEMIYGRLDGTVGQFLMRQLAGAFGHLERFHSGVWRISWKSVVFGHQKHWKSVVYVQH